MSVSAPVREGAMLLVASSEFSWLALTTDQARILRRVVYDNGKNIAERWSPGILDGLSQSLHEIETAGGAYIRKLPALP